MLAGGGRSGSLANGFSRRNEAGGCDVGSVEGCSISGIDAGAALSTRSIDGAHEALLPTPSELFVMDVRILSKNCSEQCEVLSKTAAIAIRDALVLQLCCDVDSMSYDCFKFAVESAFEIPNTKDFKYTCEEHDLVSQMHLSCNSIRTLARNRENFDQKMEKIPAQCWQRISTHSSRHMLDALLRHLL